MKLYEMLPQSPETILHSQHEEQAVIKRVLYFVQIFSEAKLAFNSGMLHLFDAHVGETCCQIRAYAVALAFQNRKIKTVLSSLNIDVVLSLLEDLKLSRYRVYRKKSMQVTIRELFAEVEESLMIQEIEVFLITSHFLSSYKQDDSEGISQAVNIKGFQLSQGESKTYAQKLCHHFQFLNSRLSVEFIDSWFKELKGKVELITTPNILTKFQKVSEYSRRVYPCFCITEVMIRHAQYLSKIPLGIILTQESQRKNVGLIVVSNSDNDFEFINPVDLSPQEPMLLIRASTRLYDLQEFMDIFHRIGLVKMLLCIAADHPQFSGKKLESYSTFKGEHFDEDDKAFYVKFCDLKEASIKGGFSTLNSSCFFVKHFLACVKNKFKILSNTFPSLNFRHSSVKELTSAEIVFEKELL